MFYDFAFQFLFLNLKPRGVYCLYTKLAGYKNERNYRFSS